MSSAGDSKFRLDELSLQASALRAQILERCRRTLNHDLNNSVQSIHSGLELLAKCVNAPAVVRVTPQECLNLLQQQFTNLQSTFRKVLNDIAEPPGEPESVDFSAVCNEVLQTLRHERALSKAKIQVEPGLSVHARKANLRSIVFGLLFDAIDHVQPQATLSVRVERQDRRITVEVRVDSLTDAPRDESQSRALSDMLAALIGAEDGELRVERAASHYVLTMSFTSASSAVDVHEATSGAATKKILIADRNRDAADSLAMILQLEGHQAQTVYTGGALNEALESFAPDVVLLDSDLPGCDPIEVASLLRARKGGRPLLAQVSSTERSSNPAFDANLIRPVEWPQLQSLLQLTVDNRG